MLWGKKESRKGKREEPFPESNEGLPDSHRPSGLCPRCGKQSIFEIFGSLPVTFDSSYTYDGERPADARRSCPRFSRGGIGERPPACVIRVSYAAFYTVERF